MPKLDENEQRKRHRIMETTLDEIRVYSGSDVDMLKLQDLIKLYDACEIFE